MYINRKLRKDKIFLTDNVVIATYFVIKLKALKYKLNK